MWAYRLVPEGVQSPSWNMGAKEDVMGLYCFGTFLGASVLFGVRQLLLKDAAHSRISKAAEYVPVVEVSLLLSNLLSGALLCHMCWLRSVFSSNILLQVGIHRHCHLLNTVYDAIYHTHPEPILPILAVQQ